MLQSSVGKQLKQARIARSLSIEQVAHATKIRPDRVVDLENDELSNFPDLAYAKGFLILYAKYLNVDVSDFTSTLNGSRRVGVGDYEYLQHATPRPGATARPEPKQSPVAFLVLFFGALFIVLGFFLVPKLFQIGSFDEVEKRRLITEAEATPSPAASTPPSPRPPPPERDARRHPLPMEAPAAEPVPTAAAVVAEPTVIAIETPTEAIPTPAPVATPPPAQSPPSKSAVPSRCGPSLPLDERGA